MSKITTTFKDGDVLQSSKLNEIIAAINDNDSSISQQETKISNLKGKKVSFIGDSITTYSGYLPSGNATRYPRGVIQSVDQTWWKQLIDQTSMVLGQNCAWDGSTCVGLSTSTSNAYGACSDKRISQLGLNGTPDIVICFIGINDWGETYNKCGTQYGGTFVNGMKVEVGSYTGESTAPSGELKTFSEAYGAMLFKIQQQYPLAKIYACTLLTTNAKANYQYDDDGVFPSINDGITLASYNNCIRTLANNMGCEIIDFAKCGIHWGNLSTYMEDGLHPNIEGMKLLAAKAKAKLISDFGESVVEKTMFTVTNSLTHVINSNTNYSVASGSSYFATIQAESGYNLQSVTITMGSSDITSSVYNNGTIMIPTVTGNIVITASASEDVGPVTTYNVSLNLSSITSSNNATTVNENSSYNTTLSVNSGYSFSACSITMGGTDITQSVFNQSNMSISISSVTGNIIITASAQEQQETMTWYTNFSQTSTNSFVASSRGWALDEETYANIYNKPINRISFVATANSGTIDICIAPSKDAQSGFTNQQTINWTSANKSGNIVTLELSNPITLYSGKYLCVYVNSTPATGAACYAQGGSAGQFYSYVASAGHSTWGGKGSYSIQMNIGYYGV